MAQDVRYPNVRFFLGTREHYNSVTNPNPLALYFCQDTGELFRGAQCISDGVRVVQELPELAQAAKGKLYYLLNAREGYVAAPDGTAWIQVIHANIDISQYYTKEEVEASIAKAISNAALEGAEVDLSDYALKADIPDVSEFIREIPEEYVTDAELEEKGYLKEHQDLSAYALAENIPNKTSQLVNDSNFITSIPDEYITEDELNAKTFATEEYVEAKVNNIPAPDLTDYAKKTDLPDTTIYAKKTELPDFELYAKKADLPDMSVYLKEVPAEFITETELANKGYITEHQDLSNYATSANVAEQLLNKVDNTRKINNKALSADIILTAADVGALPSNTIIPSIEGLAAESYVDSKITGLGLAGYAKLEDIPDTSAFITTIPDEYVTEAELTAKGYLTEHQSLEGYATESYVDNIINNLELPEPNDIDLSSYYTKVETSAAINSAVLEKANKVPFKTDKTVATACGGFAAGDPLNGLTITQIFAKLFGLESNNDQGSPDTPKTAVDQIILEELPMYQITSGGQLEEVTYSYMAMTAAEAAVAPTEAGFYQIISDGTVIESGYQQFTCYENELFYMIAFPSIIKLNSAEMQVSVKIWDNGAREWKNVTGFVEQLTSDMELIQSVCSECDLTVPIVPEGYTLWANLDAVNNGEKYRFVIKEVNG